MCMSGKDVASDNPYADIANRLNDDLKELMQKQEKERLEQLKKKEEERKLEKERLVRENELAKLKVEKKAKEFEKLKTEKKTKIKAEFTNLCYEAITSFDMAKIGETQQVTFKTRLFQEISEIAKKDIQFNEEMRQRLEREGAKFSDVQFSLLWDNYNDLDLHVICPSGERIHGGNKKSACGGELDVDANVSPETIRPVENIVWPGPKAPGGTYKTYVHHYKKHKKRRSRDPTKFKVVCNAGGEILEYEGKISSGDPMMLICEFTIDDPGARVANAIKVRDSNIEGTSSMYYQIFDEVLKESQESLAEFGYDLSTNDACNFKIKKEIKPF